MAMHGARATSLPLMNLVTTKGMPILQQLYLEEGLLRGSSDNWCIVNDGTDSPAIVMGVSGKPLELLEVDLVLRDGVSVIRRYSGGGTVIVDDRTIFVTLICRKDAVPGLLPYPRDIMSWTGKLYHRALSEFGDFQLRENDYTFDNRKFGGNAQSITKERWVHHTSFLFDYNARNMDYLKIPKKAPEFRLGRSHVDFLCRMKEYLPSSSIFIDKVITAIKEQFVVEPIGLENILVSDDNLITTKLLRKEELQKIMQLDRKAA